MRSIVLTFLFFMSPNMVLAAFLSGNQLKQELDQHSASGRLYVAGVVDTFAAAEKIGKNKMCFPDSGTLSQAEAVILKYLNDNPQDLHWPASYLAIYALSQAFPCKK